MLGAKPKGEPKLNFSFRSVRTKLLYNSDLCLLYSPYSTVMPARELGDVPAPSFHYSQPYDTQVCYNDTQTDGEVRRRGRETASRLIFGLLWLHCTLLCMS